MAVSLAGLRVEVKITGTQVDSDGIRQSVSYSYDKTFTDGSGDNQADKFWYDETRSLNATSEDLDLGTGGLTDYSGTDLVLGDVKLIVAQNLDTDSGDTLTFKAASTNDAGILGGTSPTLLIPPGGLMLLVAPLSGHAIADGSADRIAFQTADNSTYRVLIAGGV